MAIRLRMDEIRPELEATLRCRCDEIIIKAQDGVEKLRAKVLIIKGNGVFAVCRKCNTEVEVPLQKSDLIRQDVNKPTVPGPRLYLDR